MLSFISWLVMTLWFSMLANFSKIEFFMAFSCIH